MIHLRSTRVTSLVEILVQGLLAWKIIHVTTFSKHFKLTAGQTAGKGATPCTPRNIKPERLGAPARPCGERHSRMAAIARPDSESPTSGTVRCSPQDRGHPRSNRCAVGAGDMRAAESSRRLAVGPAPEKRLGHGERLAACQGYGTIRGRQAPQAGTRGRAGQGHGIRGRPQSRSGMLSHVASPAA